LFKFERAFEAIRKNKKDCKETLRKYSFRKSRKDTSANEQVGPIFINNTEKDQ
jgi:hypothetical protein